MPFTPAFTATQTIGFPNVVTITDASTGSDGAITQRRIFLTTGYNTYLVPSGIITNYVTWSTPYNPINIAALDKDYALNIVIQYLNNAGTVLYTTSQIVSFTLYNEQFLYDLTQDQTAEYQIIQDTVYYTNKEIMRVEVDSGNQAVTLASDIAGAQSCYDRATFMRVNQDKFF